jgi:tetratricopeptide (TPR) repeat protein
MQIPRFYIIQYIKLTAIAAVVFAVVLSQSPESGALVLGKKRIVSERLDVPPVDALGWFVQGRFFDERHCYDQAIVAYETILRMPLFERKALQRETGLRLTVACVRAGRPQEAIRWAELALRHEVSSSGKYLLHQLAGKAYSALGQTDREEIHKQRAQELASAANETEWLVDSLEVPVELGLVKSDESRL